MVEYVVGLVVSDEAAALPRGMAERSVEIAIKRSDDNYESRSMSRS